MRATSSHATSPKNHLRAVLVPAILAVVMGCFATQCTFAGLYFDTVSTDGPLGYWRLDETAFGGSGDVADAGGGAHDGTYTNTGAITLAQPGPRPADGFPGLEAGNYAPSFAGSGSGRVDLPAGFLPTGGDLRSFSGWFNGTSGTQQNWFNYGPDSNGRRVSITAGTSRVAVAVSGHNYGLNGLSLSPGWHHIGISQASSNSNDWIFVLDGVDRTADAVTIAGSRTIVRTTDTTNRRIGLNVGGLIDEVAVFDYPMTVVELQDQYNAALGVTPPAKVQTSFADFEFQTAARNGQSPATSGAFAGAQLYVRERANNNDPQLEVRAFMKFDLDGLRAFPIESATLLLHEYDKLNNQNSAALYIAAVTEDWDATSNLPSFTQAIDAASEFRFSTNGPARVGSAIDLDFAIDVTDIVRQWQADPASNLGFRLRIGDAFVGAAFNHDGPGAPVLVVNQIVPEPGSLLLFALGIVVLLPLAGRKLRRSRTAARGE